MQTLITKAENVGMRLDKFLSLQLGLSRREVLMLLEHNCISLNNTPVGIKSKGQLLNQADQLGIRDYTDILSTKIQANPDIHLNILSEGSDYVVVDKPAGMPVMPLKATETNTVLNAIAARHPQMQDVGKSGGEGGLGSGVVHRLDTDTSGTLVLATEESRWQDLRTTFKNHETTKRYRAIVHGILQGSGSEEMNLVIAQHKPAKVRVVTRPEQSNSSERRCNLSWQSVQTFRNSSYGRGASLIEVELGTGFLHQIRVMFAHMGHPVIGDKVYSNKNATILQAQRQMLHASYIKVMDIEAQSPDPEDFANLLKSL